MCSEKNIYSEYLQCPECQGVLDIQNEAVVCSQCSKTFPKEKDIIDFYIDEPSTQNYSTLRANIDFYDQVGEFYESHMSSEGIGNPYCSGRVDEILSLISSETNSRLLIDLGCGTGHILSMAQKYFEQNMGFDISPAMLLESKRKGLTVFRGNIEKLPLKSNSADAVTCFSVLHHMKDQTKLFEEAYRILKPGSYLYTDNDPNYYAKHIIQGSKLYNLLLNFYHKVFGRKKDSKFKNIDDEVRKLAEYHHHHTSGLNIEALADTLQQLNFKKINIVPHGNVKSYKKNNFFNCPWYFQAYMLFGALMSLKWDYKYIAPHFLILAVK